MLLLVEGNGLAVTAGPFLVAGFGCAGGLCDVVLEAGVLEVDAAADVDPPSLARRFALICSACQRAVRSTKLQKSYLVRIAHFCVAHRGSHWQGQKGYWNIKMVEVIVCKFACQFMYKYRVILYKKKSIVKRISQRNFRVYQSRQKGEGDKRISRSLVNIV